MPSQQGKVDLLDPLQLLQRVESSDGYSKMRTRLASKERAISARPASNDNSVQVPTYLALDAVEANVIAVEKKQQKVAKCKDFYAGGEERSSFLVRQWIDSINK